MSMTTQTADRKELDTTRRSFAATRFAEALCEKIVSQSAMPDIDIQTPDWPGQTETILGELRRLRKSNAFLEKRQTEIEAELSLAARVQQSLAPRSLVWNDVSVETYYSPAHTIGGTSASSGHSFGTQGCERTSGTDSNTYHCIATQITGT